MLDCDLVRGLVLDRVAVLAGHDRPDPLAVLGHGDAGAQFDVIRGAPLDAVQVRQRVTADPHRVARPELLDLRGAVGARSGDADREQHNCCVDDVPAVAAPVAGDES